MRMVVYYCLYMMLCIYIKCDDDLIFSSRTLQWTIYEGTVPVAEIPKEDFHYHFIHIPKNAGASWLRSSPSVLRTGNTMVGNNEQSFEKTSGNVSEMVVLLRSPRAHVVSQFLECKYDKFGKKVTKNTDFPGHGKEKEWNGGLLRWLQHFIDQGMRSMHVRSLFRMDHYGCYNPWDMQTRYLSGGHGTHDMTSWPSFDNARRHVSQVAFVGIADFYVESRCLFEYLNTGDMHRRCGCREENSEELLHITHSVPSHDPNLLSDYEKDLIDILTRRDEKLFRFGLYRFSRYAAKVHELSGVDVFCGNRSKLSSFLYSTADGNIEGGAY